MAVVERLGESFSSHPIKNHTDEKKVIQRKPRVNFSFRKEIFFVTISSLIGAIAMFVPRIIYENSLKNHHIGCSNGNSAYGYLHN